WTKRATAGTPPSVSTGGRWRRSGRLSGVTGKSRSHGRCRGTRLVASTRRPGHVASRASAAAAAASTCSTFSSTNRTCLPWRRPTQWPSCAEWLRRLLRHARESRAGVTPQQLRLTHDVAVHRLLELRPGGAGVERQAPVQRVEIEDVAVRRPSRRARAAVALAV